MVCLITGFPSKIAALQFEWSWQNTHITRHIPAEERITSCRITEYRTKKGGTRTRKTQPRYSVNDKLANLHLMLRVKSFRRWPLNISFFAADLHQKWEKLCKTTARRMRSDVTITCDYQEPKAAPPIDADLSKNLPETPNIDSNTTTQPSGAALVDVGYGALKPHIMKTSATLDGKRTMSCAVCLSDLNPQQDLMLFCHHDSCRMTSHLTCLSNHFLENEADRELLLPLEGACPWCAGKLLWSNLLKELTLRTRGQNEILHLMKKLRQRKRNGVVDSNDASRLDGDAIIGNNAASGPVLTGFDWPALLNELEKTAVETDDDHGVCYRGDPKDDEEESDNESLEEDSEVEQQPLQTHGGLKSQPKPIKQLPRIIADSDTEEIEEIML